MRSVSRGVRVFSLSVSLGLVLAACGGSTSKKDGGSDAATGADGTAGSDAAAGTDGGGTAGAGTAGQSATDGGAAGAAGADASGDVATEAGAAGAEGGVVTTDGGDASAPDGSTDVSVDATTPVSLCGAYAIHAPVVAATINNTGAAPYVAGFLGGALASGTYYLTTVVHFGATYAGPTQEVLVVDATAHTLGDASVVGTTTTYVGYATTISTANVLVGAASCGGATATSWNYLVTGTGAGSTLSLNAVGSSDVKVFTKQ
jgi:hypothetical protein